MQVDALRDELRRHRLERNLSYEDLAADIAKTLGEDRRLSLRTVYSFITEDDTRPYETTVYTVQCYLERVALERSA
jgi:hypothetical protein